MIFLKDYSSDRKLYAMPEPLWSKYSAALEKIRVNRLAKKKKQSQMEESQVYRKEGMISDSSLLDCLLYFLIDVTIPTTKTPSMHIWKKVDNVDDIYGDLLEESVGKYEPVGQVDVTATTANSLLLSSSSPMQRIFEKPVLVTSIAQAEKEIQSKAVVLETSHLINEVIDSDDDEGASMSVDATAATSDPSQVERLQLVKNLLHAQLDKV